MCNAVIANLVCETMDPPSAIGMALRTDVVCQKFQFETAEWDIDEQTSRQPIEILWFSICSCSSLYKKAAIDDACSKVCDMVLALRVFSTVHLRARSSNRSSSPGLRTVWHDLTSSSSSSFVVCYWRPLRDHISSCCVIYRFNILCRLLAESTKDQASYVSVIERSVTSHLALQPTESSHLVAAAYHAVIKVWVDCAEDSATEKDSRALAHAVAPRGPGFAVLNR